MEVVSLRKQKVGMIRSQIPVLLWPVLPQLTDSATAAVMLGAGTTGPVGGPI